MEINVSEAKEQLSNLINKVHRGERVVICKNNLPLVDLVPHNRRGNADSDCFRVSGPQRKILRKKTQTLRPCFTVTRAEFL